MNTPIDTVYAIRDSQTGEVFEFENSAIEILGDDNRPMFRIYLQADGTLEISAGMVCKYNSVMLADKLQVEPRASNLIYIRKPRLE